MSRKKLSNRLDDLFADLQQASGGLGPPDAARELAGASAADSPPEITVLAPPPAEPPLAALPPEPQVDSAPPAQEVKSARKRRPSEDRLAAAPAEKAGKETPIPAPAWPQMPRQPNALGFAADDLGVQPARKALTPAGSQSLLSKQTVSQPAHTDHPAVLALTATQGDQANLLLEILGEDGTRQWSEDERRLAEQVLDQLSMAMENARLFENIQTALLALEVRERYQTNVAQAVAELTDQGNQAIPEMLRFLAAAAGCVRAYYFETLEDAGGVYWRLVDEWFTPGLPPLRTDPALQRVPADSYPSWAGRLSVEGQISAPAPSFIPLSRGDSWVRACLALAVPGGHELPGFIAFEDPQPERAWGVDEISSLQTAASALSSTLAREHNLDETNILYQASADLNLASGYSDVLEVLRTHTFLGLPELAELSLYVFDSPWTATSPAEWAAPLTRWTPSLEEATPAGRYHIASWSAGEWLNPDLPTFIGQVRSDPRLNAAALHIFEKVLKAHSILLAPLNVAGKWFGEVIGVFRQPVVCSAAQMRRLTSLVSQAALTVEGLRLLDETRRRNEQLAALNLVISTASESLDLERSLSQILGHVLKILGFEAGLVSVVDPLDGELRLAVHQNLPPPLLTKLTSLGLKGTLCELVYLRQDVVAVEDFKQGAPLDVSGLLALGLNAYLGVPIQSKSQVQGTLCVFSQHPQNVNQESIRLMQTIGQQIGVAVENARLFEQIQSALSETETLYQASADLNTAQSYDEVLTILRRHTILGSGQGSLLTLGYFDRAWSAADQPDYFDVLARWSDGPMRTPALPRYPLKAFEWLLRNFRADSAAFVEDASTDASLDDYSRRWAETQDYRSTILIPLNIGGELRGFFGGFYRQAQRFSEVDRRRLMTLASQASVAIQSIRLLDDSRRRADQLQTAAEIARDTSGTLALEQMLERAVELIRARFSYDHASIFLLNEDGSQAVVRAATGAAGSEMKKRGHSLMVGSRSIIGRVTADGQPVVINNVASEGSRVGSHPIHRHNPLLPDTRAELALPLRLGERVIGALDLQSNQVDAFKSDDIVVLQVLADQIAISAENARAYAMVQRAVEEMRKADQLKSQFLANMSHELRTPLNSIIGFSRVILKGIDGPITDLQQQDLSAIYSSGQHLLNLINDILDLSKIEAGKMELAFEDHVNIPDLIQSVMSTVTGLLKDKPLQLQKEIASDLPTVRADPMKVRQVLINLLSNAAKFTEQGTITLKVEGIAAGPSGEREVRLSVSDTGPGIAEEDQDKLFLPFSQVDGSASRKSGGSGLGLSICRRLVEMHGGQIGVNSIPGEGSTFYFTLPVSLTARLNLPELLPGKRAVLSVDLDPQVVGLYERYLKDHNYQVIGLNDPHLALEAVRQLKPSAVTLDIAMPDFDGWALLEALNSDPATHRIPVVVCSLLDNRERAFNLGAAGYLLKPILEEDLVQALEIAVKSPGNGSARYLQRAQSPAATNRSPAG